ncbi:MAG TPA: type II secretion system protein GspM [Noviherbaspirillum sp.]|nr:type II secretion system protein GspM [Noviherbaspirillum sp.]
MNRLQAMRQSAVAYWNERNARERTMLAAAAGVLVLALIYLLLLDPALSGREELAQRLPALRQQAAEVQALTREAAAAGSRTAATAPAVTRETLQTSLSRRGLQAQEISVSGELVRLRFEGASFAAQTEWLAEMHRTARLAVVEAKVEAGGEPDSVNAAYTLRQERGQAQ